MSGSNCCFLTCIQIFQEAGKVVWYSHLLKTFPQFVVIHTVKGFGVVSKAKVDIFLELSCFFYSSAVSKSSLNIWMLVQVLLKHRLENFEHYFASVWDECNCAVVWTFFGIAFLWNRMKTDLFLSATLIFYGHCCIFQICWHIISCCLWPIFLARILEWVKWLFPSPEDLPNPGLNPGLLHCRWILNNWATREALGHFSNMNSSNPWTHNIFPFCMSSSVSFVSVLNSSQCRSLSSSVKFIPRCFVLFDAVVNEIVFLISLSDSLLLMYRNVTDFCIFILNNTLHSLTT